VLYLLKENYINKDQLSWTQSVDYSDIWDFVDTLNEEYTVYLDPKEWKKFMDSLNWEFAWIWVYLVQKGNENPIISEVIKWSPAETAGLQAEDIIISIDWKYLKDFEDVNEFIDALKWDKWTSVSIQIQRNWRTLTKKVDRDIIQLPTSDAVKVWDICYVRLYSFDIW
jgi:carboxyl-terminal processing protease